ncbi:MAG: sulfatase-like hydrolase/transferase [Wenzhouxiangella sp.]
MQQGNTSSDKVGRALRPGSLIVVALALVLPPFLFIPLQIYSANIYDLSAGLSDILPGLLTLATVALIVGLLLTVTLSMRWPRLVLAVTAGLAVLVWLQGQLMVWDYGVLDGSAIRWRDYRGRSALELLVWIAVLWVAVVYRKPIADRTAWIALILLVIQSIPVALALHQRPMVPEFHRYSFDDGHKYSFSSEQNVVVIVFDAFQADIFQELINKHPRWREEFDGFTFFRNALAGYSKTYPSLALMLTGQWYENDQPVQQFIRTSFLQESLPRTMIRDGWRVDLFPHIKRVVHVSPRVASNAIPVIECKTARAETGRLVDLGLFRISPHQAKPYWLNDYHWRLAALMPQTCPEREDGPVERNDAPHRVQRFIHDLKLSNASLDQPAFKLFHFLIPHAPFHLDEQLNLARLPNGRESFYRQSHASLEVLSRFLDRLHEHGIYDDTLVVVVSDHGGGEYTNEVRVEELGSGFHQNEPANMDIPPGHLASGLPLILIKPPAARGELAVSDAPVSLGDLAQTMADLAQLPGTYPGRNMFQIEPTEQRQRRYLFYSFAGWSGEYLPEMTEYLVDDFSWFSANWTATGQTLSPARQPTPGLRPEYRLGELVRFRPSSSALAFLQGGWSEPTVDGMVWSTADRADIEVNLGEPVAGSLIARFEFLPFTARGAIDGPRVEVRVNDEIVQAWETSRRGWHEVRIPARIAEVADSLHFDFRFPDAVSPYEMGISGDQRTLGIALYRMKIEHADNQSP